MRSLFLLLTFAQALWIDVPFVKQDKNGCGSASVWMVMEYWKRGPTPEVEEIHRELYSNQAGGVFARDMEKYLQAHGYRVFPFRAEWTDLEQHIAQGRPLIVCLERNARGVPLHYVVVAGLDSLQNLVLVNDPAQRKLLSMSRAEFEQSWKATDNWTLLAVPELELAGNAFRNDKLSEATDHLKLALHSTPSDAYTNEFLATVYFLQDNTEAALRYWNRIGKPLLENIITDPPLKTDPVLLDHAVAFSRGSVLKLDEFYSTQARLKATGVFSRYKLELSPAEGDRFNVTLRAAERNGPAFLSWFRGLPYKALHPEFSNIGRKAMNVNSMLRWDTNKRRAYVSFASPLKGNPKWGFHIGLDGRDENWADTAGDFRMRKAEVAAHIRSIPNGRWTWTSGAAVSQRRLSNSYPSGVELKYFGSADRALLRDTDRRLTVTASLSLEAGKMFLQDPQRFAKLESGLSARWFPVSQREDNEITAKLRTGRIFGTAPFDECFVVGLERDSDVWLRGHSATVRGLKNSAFTSRSFVLASLDFQKVIHDWGLLRFSAGPFIDTARVASLSSSVVDTGLQLRFTALGTLKLDLSYGRSLRDSQSAFFTNIGR